jgi:outer membrane protein TolC
MFGLGIISFVAASTAQTFPSRPPSLTLQECVRIAREESPLGLAARREYESAIFDYKAFEASLLPQIGINGNAPNFVQSINPITQPDGAIFFVPQSQMFSTLSLSAARRR